MPAGGTQNDENEAERLSTYISCAIILCVRSVGGRLGFILVAATARVKLITDDLGHTKTAYSHPPANS